MTRSFFPEAGSCRGKARRKKGEPDKELASGDGGSMCGRFTLTIPDATTIADALGAFVAPEVAAAWRPRFNVAPTDAHVVARPGPDGRLELVAATWGLVPHWSKDAKAAARAINARSESARTAPMFRDAFARRRCLVPADGFYEWTGEKAARKPLWFHAPDGGLVTFAGLTSSWVDPAGARHRTFTILTTRANDVVAPAHDRMPVVLAASDRAAWLAAEPADAAALMKPAPAGALAVRAVSRRVNQVANDDPTLLEPEADAPPPQSNNLSLFGPETVVAPLAARKKRR
ncbi:MAG TPA: SOS response-associated peptidase [Byssovorax sp.]